MKPILDMLSAAGDLAQLITVGLLIVLAKVVWTIKTNDLHAIDVVLGRILTKLGMSIEGDR